MFKVALMVFALCSVVLANASPINTSVRSILPNSDHIEMTLLGNSTVYATTGVVLPQTSDTAWAYLFHAVSTDSTGLISYPSGSGTFWFISFDAGISPIKLDEEEGQGFSCPCSSQGTCALEGAYFGGIHKLRCRQSSCEGQCSMLIEDSQSIPIAFGPGVIVEATAINFNGVLYN